MAEGMLEVEGTIRPAALWPTGSSDADTSTLVVQAKAGSFKFRDSDRARYHVTRAFEGATVVGRVRKTAIDDQHRVVVRLQAPTHRCCAVLATALVACVDPASTVDPAQASSSSVMEASPHGDVVPRCQPDGYEGIGAAVERTARGVAIMGLTAHGPAQKGGVLVGDIVELVDGRPVAQDDLLTILHRLMGPAGTKVVIGLRRGTSVIRTENRSTARSAAGRMRGRPSPPLRTARSS